MNGDHYRKEDDPIAPEDVVPGDTIGWRYLGVLTAGVFDRWDGTIARTVRGGTIGSRTERWTLIKAAPEPDPDAPTIEALARTACARQHPATGWDACDVHAAHLTTARVVNDSVRAAGFDLTPTEETQP